MSIITLRFKGKKIRDYPIVIGQNCSIGRKKSNDIVIDNLSVSGNHAKIESVATNFVLRDLDSTNGTFINKEKIRQRNLRHKDLIQIGKHELFFDRSDLMKKSSTTLDPYDNDKTRILDTNEYRHLMNKEQNVSSTADTINPIESRQHKESSFFTRLLKKIFG